MNNYDIYSSSYNEFSTSEINNLQWYYDDKKMDKIGINFDGSELTHDIITYKLKQFRKLKESVNYIENNKTIQINTIQLIYKLSLVFDDNDSNKINEKCFTDLMLHEKSSYVIFKYAESFKGNMIFSHITFNGKTFKK